MKYLICITILIYSQSLAAQPNAIYRGGDGAGYDNVSIISSNQDYFLGGYQAGYAIAEHLQANNLLYFGGTDNGYNSSTSSTVNTDYFKGGSDDGYAYLFYRTPFIWTGTVGTSWTVPGNWNYNLIPGIYRPVIIPDGVPNWPFVNAGLLAIADTPNGSNYRCATLWIQENAFLQTRVNCRIENYGVVQIDGEMRVKKITADAFQNFASGVVIINDGGELKIKP